MEKILTEWLSSYTGCSVNFETKFKDLNFDLFDEAMTVDFVAKNFQTNVNTSNVWFDSVKDLIDAIAAGS